MSNMEEQLRKEWREESKYPGDHEPKLGCCGGDYCDTPKIQNHNEKIADWWLTKMKDYSTALIAEIEKEIEQTHKDIIILFGDRILKEQLKGRVDGLSKAQEVIKKFL